MNGYKKIIKNKKTRDMIIHFFDKIDDKTMLKIQYRIKTGRRLNLKNPERYTEKLQWYKLYYRDPLMTVCSDKNAVREYVKNKGLGNILNEQFGCYKSVDEINFDELPEQFVIKSTTGSGNNIIVKNKQDLDVEAVKEEVTQWLKKKKSLGREWCYYEIEPQVIVEKFIGRDENNDLPDYKFFCFNGEVYCLYTMVNYTDDHKKGQLGFYDKNFEKLPYCRCDYRDIDFEIKKPKNFDKMVEYAEILSKDFPHARIDFYNLDGNIIFGEITFYNASGYTAFNPDDFDFILGEKFILPEKNYKKESVK